MRADSIRMAVAAARWSGRELSTIQIDELRALESLLRHEATRAGGIGPNETDRLWGRHIGDALLFGTALPGASSCIDVGSGAGLPGLPLAIAFPEVEFDLVDKSGRRCDLIRRMLAVLNLRNCQVVHRDIASVDKIFDAVVSRAAMPPERLMIHVKRLLGPAGVAVIGHSWVGSEKRGTIVAPIGMVVEYVEVPVDILDSPVNLLRIAAT
jgi:16S rRNA (guanine527-N7)-methyltransferase